MRNQNSWILEVGMKGKPLSWVHLRKPCVSIERYSVFMGKTLLTLSAERLFQLSLIVLHVCKLHDKIQAEHARHREVRCPQCSVHVDHEARE